MCVDGCTKHVSGKSNFLEDASKRRGGVKSIATELSFPQVRNPIGWSPEKIINHATRMYYQTPFPPGGCEMNARTSTTASTDRRLDGTGTPCARTFPKRLVVGMGKGEEFSELNAKPPARAGVDKETDESRIEFIYTAHTATTRGERFCFPLRFKQASAKTQIGRP